MAAIRHNLQQEIFRPSGEALYAVVNVVKVGVGKKKEKKTTFLCAAGIFLIEYFFNQYSTKKKLR